MLVRSHKDVAVENCGTHEAVVAAALAARTKAEEAEARVVARAGQRPQGEARRERAASSYTVPSHHIDLVAGLVCAAVALYFAAGFVAVFMG